nr:uncharacterized protein LOC109192458 [Ipomoea batatas]
MVCHITMKIQEVMVVFVDETMVIISAMDKIIMVAIEKLPPKMENNGAKHDKEKRGNHPKNVENICYHCGMTGHWKLTCCTARHLVNLYQASLKEKGKNIESNNVLVNDGFDITHLDVEDYLGPIEKKD